MQNIIKIDENVVLHYVQLTIAFQTRFLKGDKNEGVKWLIHSIKHRKDNQLQSLELSCKISQ